MYLSTVERPRREPGAARTRAWVGANVLALGAVSLITDVSAEMVTAVLPVYLLIGLQLTPVAFGLLDGLHTGATALLRLAGGYVADRTDRRKLVAGLGYTLSAAAKPALLLVRSAGGIAAVIAVDRAGKGLRTAPRDALISLSSPPDGQGRAFGVHRTMDAFGAFLGPLAALGVLAASASGSAAGSAAWSAQSFDAVFVASGCVAALGVVVLVLFVRDRRASAGGTVARTAVSPRAVRDLLRDPAVVRLTAAAAVLGTATIGEGFVYLLLQRREDLGITWFPLLAVGTNVVFLSLATPLGLLADRIGRGRVLLGIGYPALLLVYVLLAVPVGGAALLVLTLALFGLFFAATDGVLMALAAPVLPEAVRTSGMAVVQTAQALAYLLSSVLFGVAWQYLGAGPACLVAAGAVALALGASAALLRGGRT